MSDDSILVQRSGCCSQTTMHALLRERSQGEWQDKSVRRDGGAEGRVESRGGGGDERSATHTSSEPVFCACCPRRTTSPMNWGHVSQLQRSVALLQLVTRDGGYMIGELYYTHFKKQHHIVWRWVSVEKWCGQTPHTRASLRPIVLVLIALGGGR